MIAKKWLRKPYFFYISPKVHITLALVIGLFIFMFLYIFQPFGMSDLENNLFLYCLGFGFITFIVQSSLFIILPLVFKDYFKNENWTIGRNIFFLVILITSISTCNWFYNTLVQNTENWRMLTLKEIFSYTFSISIFPILIYTFFSEKVYRHKREKVSKDIMKRKVSSNIEKLNKEITLYGDNQKDKLTFSIHNLVYITSQGNYVSFYLYLNGKLKEKILRNTLKSIADKLKNTAYIYRCHKSYIINSIFMDAISGNARGYFLESELLSKQIPISRSFKKDNLKNLIR
ncbi:LytTR family DNA-binding domain-containing protein [Polaribacter sp. Hel1_85]|uniref:LytTR family DNA-binding domain-containing protein n=1 Tax=Polaribacter sp. Hel1_85 TaxID=1250005 RepID=UPI00052E1BBF|nr:LytTR family DNA-binding domain-containing protein [Polaribacter sp. Hel1_85]KGL62419.1 transcriptional regulator, LytTr family [Polaribacter sp. Hel1_85]